MARMCAQVAFVVAFLRLCFRGLQSFPSIRSDFTRRARTARPRPMRLRPATLWKTCGRKSSASGHVSDPYEFPYSQCLLGKGTARIDGKQWPAAVSRSWNPLRGGHGHDFPLPPYQLRGVQHRAGISYPRVAPTKYCKGLGGLDDYFETFYTGADFEHFTPRFKERM